jgi:hypothetical protein
MANEPYVAQVASKAQASATSGKAITSVVLGLASFFCAFLTGIVAVIMGVLALGDISKSQGRLHGNGLAITGIVTGAIGCLWTIPLIGVVIGMTLPAVQQVREAARRAQSMNNIQQMTLSMHNYESRHASFPPAKDGEGQQLSWRVHILPYLEQQGLYDQFHLDEPWDSPHNLTLVDKMPEIFKNPNLDLPTGQTTYLVPTTPISAKPNLPHAMFTQGQQGPKFSQITDGASNTILIVEADPGAAVVWTDPDGDLMYDPNDPMRSLGSLRPGVIVVGNADGSCHCISNRMSPEELNAMMTRDGGETVDPFH